MLARPLMANLKIIVRDDHAVPACRHPPTSVYESSCNPWLSEWGGNRPLDRCPPPSPLPTHLLASEIKQTFLSTNLACLLTFE